ncbi:MAG: hypothetical protein U0U70_01140 [Chitinophagaceae bacterium]
MKRIRLLQVTVLISLCACGRHQPATSDTTAAPYGKPVPVILGIHSDLSQKDSIQVDLINTADTVAFHHQGPVPGWGMQETGKKVPTGEYTLLVHWKDSTTRREVKRKLLIKPATAYFSLNIELHPDGSGIYLDQYTDSLPGVTFKRMWDPAHQFGERSIISPDYTVINNNDSTIYGAYQRWSSMLSINWVQRHYIAFMQFEAKTDSGWQSMGCETPRIQMDLKKGAKGETLRDMILGCPVNNFKPGHTYRVRIDYMINDARFEKTEAQGDQLRTVFMEQTIHMFRDEFVRK